MKTIIKSVKDFKIIPANFNSSGAFELLDANDDEIKAKLVLLNENELSDYKAGANVEVFGVNPIGLIYFETKINKIEDKTIYLAYTDDYSIIQRREYSRVGLGCGSLVFNDLSDDFVLSVEDISAGGIKFIAKSQLNADKKYSITINMPNNLKIECELKPIRTDKIDENKFAISGKFINLENMDRIVLVQYAFKIKMENQSRT